MVKTERCEGCGVPVIIGRDLHWGDNGVITLANSPLNRMVFFESNTIDNLFKGMEELIEGPIEPIVIESRRRETRRFMEKSFPFEVRNIVLFGDPESNADKTPYSRAVMESVIKARREMNERVMEVGTVFGYGEQSLSDKWDRGERYPWRTQIIRNPYSVPLWVADTLGTVEAFEGEDMCVESEDLGGNSYRVTVTPGEHPVELKKRLKRRHYEFKPGSLRFDRCPECELPLEISGYVWNLKEGIITASDTGRRVAILGPLAIDAIFDDLEAEYGPDIQEAAIEAQRRYVKSMVGEEDIAKLMASYRSLIALRGLGNIAGFEADERRLELTIENSCLRLMLVGMAKALYELALKKESSSHAWELSKDGDLSITLQAS
jgi:hypothetical protein